MASLLQRLYWNAPHFVKNWMASINARKLDRERYGPVLQQILEEIAEHDKWSIEQFYQYQREQLRSLIQHAATKVPYYRELFAERGIDPKSIAGPEDLRKLPILEKTVIRESPGSLVDESLGMSKLVVLHTSGTTGTPLDLYRDVWLNSAAFAYFDARCHVAAGLARRVNRSASIGGHLVAAPERSRPPFWVYNRRWDQLYMSSYHLSPKYLGSYVDKLRKFKPDYIEGYASSVYAIAQYILENKLEPVPCGACFTTAEKLFDYQRDVIRQAFCCRTYNQYGCGEMAFFAAECKDGSMHLSPEFGIIEVVNDNDEPVETGQTGQLICTSLINRVQCFVRYRVGDLGTLKADGKCSCNSLLPMLASIEGRTDDVLITRDGRKIGRLDPVFKGTKGITEAQIVQNDYDKFVIRIVPSKEYTEADSKNVINNLGHRIGEADIKVELEDQIERTSAGKFKAVVRNMPQEGRD